MKNNKLKKGLLSSVAVVVVILAAIAINVLITWKDYSVDVTSSKIYSISDQTKSILDSLDQDVTFYVINSESDANDSYKKIWNEYKKHSSNIKIEYKDPELYPNFTADYVDSSESVNADSVIVVCGDKSRYISSDDYVNYSYGSDYSYTADSLELESLLTEAINYVISDETPVVYTLSGHGEKNFTTSVTSSFERDNYEVRSLNLLSQATVPEDCAVLIINGPEKDLSNDEKTQIDSYMKNGGKIYIFLDAGVDDLTNLYALMEEYNVGVSKGVVVETDSNMYTQYPIWLLPNIESSEATEAQYNSNVYVLAPSAKGLTDLSTEEETADEGETSENTCIVTPLLTTSENAYSKVDTTSSTIEKEKEDIDGPFHIAVSVSDENGGKMIVVGCTNMLEDTIDAAVSGANTDFVMNGINYLTQQESKISIRAKDLTSETAIVPAFGQKMTLILSVFVLPLFLLIVGIVIVVRRRRL